jgi:hypothetical protein
MTAETLADRIALELLSYEGAAAIWRLHVVAARVHRDGYTRAAGTLLEIADAAERLVSDD